MKEERPVFYTVRFVIIALTCAALIFALGIAFTGYVKERNSATPLPVFNKNEKIRFVIDAGHGGEDAGAIAADQTLEKDLNLEIARLLKVVLELNGNEAVLTRDSDTLLYDHYNDLEDYTGKKKVYDLKNRLKIAEEKENSIYVGIHMNKFVEPQYSGLQVYYSPKSDLSYTIANDIKNTVKANLQPQNNRQIKRADTSIYILSRAEIPAVLIECGFLSNERELELLKSEDYKRALAINLFASLVKYGN
ncbi:MAG: N-acetylmuramoyl-L-alanine amidase [Ruminococcaceae bacterium]|nr:N-acetylmuramoyl-L-alanine amidase [Oscillospiraceae bacterium]